IQTGVFWAELWEVKCLGVTKLHEKLRCGGAFRHNGTVAPNLAVSVMCIERLMLPRQKDFGAKKNVRYFPVRTFQAPCRTIDLGMLVERSGTSRRVLILAAPRRLGRPP